MNTSTAMSSPVCGRLEELLEELLGELDPLLVDPLPEPLPLPLEPLLPDVPPELLLDASTVTLPVIEGWIEQMYGNVPAFVKVWDPLLSLLIVPVSKLPSLAVAVWGAMSLFVQVIVSPT